MRSKTLLGDLNDGKVMIPSLIFYVMTYVLHT
jgi:hypothetical protein